MASTNLLSLWNLGPKCFRYISEISLINQFVCLTRLSIFKSENRFVVRFPGFLRLFPKWLSPSPMGIHLIPLVTRFLRLEDVSLYFCCRILRMICLNKRNWFSFRHLSPNFLQRIGTKWAALFLCRKSFLLLHWGANWVYPSPALFFKHKSSTRAPSPHFQNILQGVFIFYSSLLQK